VADDLGRKVTFRGPGQWRSQAERAQAGTAPPDAALEPPVPAKGVISRSPGLDWDPLEHLLVGDVARTEPFDPRLHPRGEHGKFASKPGGSHHVPPTPAGMASAGAGPGLADSGPGSIEQHHVAALAQATTASEQALSARMVDLDTRHQAEMARLTAELRSMHEDFAAASNEEHFTEERQKSLKKLVHHFLMILTTGLGLFLANKYELGPGAEIAATIGPLAVQGILDFVRKA
jgi:hypothetical protein